MNTLYFVKGAVGIAAIGAASLLYVAHRHHLSGVRRAVVWGLWPLAVLAWLAYASLGTPYAGQAHINTYDVYHYYLGAKYFDELGYLYLYDATLVAAAEDHTRLQSVREYRDQRDYRMVPAAQALARQDAWRPNFTDARWQAFKDDLAFFIPRMSLNGWRNALSDKGYNPPPVWTLAGRALAHAVPAREGPAIFLLMHVDVVFVLLAIAALAWAFNIETALLSAVFFGVNYTTPYSAVGAAFLRLDWLLALTLGLCLMKRRLHGLSGAALAYAAFLRMSPAVYGVGLVAVAARHFAATRRVPAWFTRFVLGGLIATAALVAATFALLPEPVSAWQGFAEKMATHHESLGTKRYGLQYLFVWTGETQRADLFEGGGGWAGYDRRKHTRLEQLAWGLHAAQGILLGLVIAAAYRRTPWEAMALGCVLVFAFLAPTRYYYAQMLVLIPLLAYRWPTRGRLLVLALLFGMMAVACAVHLANDLLAFIQFVVSLEMLVVFLVLLVVLLVEPRERTDDAVTLAPALAPKARAHTEP